MIRPPPRSTRTDTLFPYRRSSDLHRVALRDRPADEGVLRPQVKDVVLVDPRRDDQQRPLGDIVGRRRVLDELHEVVLVDHLARRKGDVLAEREGVAVVNLYPAEALAREEERGVGKGWAGTGRV